VPMPNFSASWRTHFTTVRVCVDHVRSLMMWTPRNSSVDVDWDVLSPLAPIVHGQLLGLTDIKGEVVLAPQCQVSDLSSSSCRQKT
jgi:hypothetical protein